MQGRPRSGRTRRTSMGGRKRLEAGEARREIDPISTALS